MPFHGLRFHTSRYGEDSCQVFLPYFMLEPLIGSSFFYSSFSSSLCLWEEEKERKHCDIFIENNNLSVFFAILFLLLFTEGYLTSCTFDYLTDSFDTRLFVGTLFTFSYCIPMTLIIYYYSQIVKHVFSHEKALRTQAKKMNVESLRSNQKGAGNTTAEVRIAKAAITICFLFVAGT